MSIFGMIVVTSIHAQKPANLSKRSHPGPQVVVLVANGFGVQHAALADVVGVQVKVCRNLFW